MRPRGSAHGDKRSESHEREIERLKKELDEARAEIERLKKELEEALRAAAKRAAAPYSNGKRVARPRKSGRKPGQGVFRRRMAPPPAEVTGPLVDVPVGETECPCGGELERLEPELATVTDLPEPKPRTTGYRVDQCRCKRCGRRFRGRHPGLAPDQHGATAHRLGPGVMAAAHALHYGTGVPVRQVPGILRELAGVSVTQGAITQDALKRSMGIVGAEYEKLRAAVPTAAVVYTDDTGWRVGGEPAQLMVFDTDSETVYQVRAQHRNEEVREIIPSGYAGTLVTDRGKSYEAEELRDMAQHKCHSHIQRNITAVLERQSGRARSFGIGIRQQLRKATRLWHERADLSPTEFAAQAARIERAVTRHLRPRRFRNADSRRLHKGLRAQHLRGRLLRFLKDPRVEPTNNRSERALRPAVIARKVSHCSQNANGAEAFAAFTSVARTMVKRGCRSLQTAFQALFTQPSPTNSS